MNVWSRLGFYCSGPRPRCRTARLWPQTGTTITFGVSGASENRNERCLRPPAAGNRTVARHDSRRRRWGGWTTEVRFERQPDYVTRRTTARSASSNPSQPQALENPGFLRSRSQQAVKLLGSSVQSSIDPTFSPLLGRNAECSIISIRKQLGGLARRARTNTFHHR